MNTTSKKISVFCIGFAFILTGLFFTACKKDKKDPEPVPANPTPAPQTNTQRLTGKNFKMTALTVDPPILGITDLYSQLEDCQKDNLIRFDEPNVFKEDEGTTKCNTNDPQTETGTWVWNTDETIITTNMGTETLSYTVVTNDGNTLKVKYTEEISGTKYTVTATYTKQ